MRRVVIQQPAIERSGHGLPQQEPGADKTEHGADRDMRGDMPDGDIARRVDPAACRPGDAERPNHQPERQRAGAGYKDQHRRQAKTEDDYKVITRYPVGKDAAGDHQQQRANLIGGQGGHRHHALKRIHVLEGNDRILSDTDIRGRRADIEQEEQHHRRGANQVAQAVHNRRALLDLVAFLDRAAEQHQGSRGDDTDHPDADDRTAPAD